jgi:hypothetical protein
MSMTLTYVLGLTALVAIIHPLLMRAITRSVQPGRLELADTGDRLLASPHISEKDSEKDKDVIDGMLNDAFSCVAMLKMVLFVPFVATRVAVDARYRSQVSSAGPKTNDHEARRDLERFKKLFIRSIAAANPLATVICALEISIVTFLLFPLGQMTMVANILSSALRKTEERRGENGNAHA